MTPALQLPALADLRSRRTEAVRLANRRLIPRLILTSVAILPAVVAEALAVTGRIDSARIIPIVLGFGIIGLLWTGYVVLDYVRRILPDELTRAGLVCHQCGKPLVAPAATSRDAARVRASTKDPDALGALDGKCASCGTWVVRDAGPGLTLGAGAPVAQPTRNSSSARA